MAEPAAPYRAPAAAGLDALFSPRSIAVVGASDDVHRIRGRLLKNLLSGGFAGTIHPVNPSRDVVQGLRCHPSVAALPAPVDLALIAVPAEQVMGVLDDCVQRGVGAAVVYASGSGAQAPGRRLQDRIAAFARQTGMRILGPNAEGFLDTELGLFATFSPTLEHVPPMAPGSLPHRGRVSIVSQSGAMAFALYGRATREYHLPVRHLVSTGNESDVELLEVVDHLVAQGTSRALLLFVEGFRDPWRFAAVAARAADAGVALIVAKVGRSDAGQRAAVSHTAHLTGADTAYDAAFARYGAIRVDTPDEMLAVAAAISAGVQPAGRRVAIVTTSGGAGGWAADLCEQAGLAVPALEPAFKGRLAELLPDGGSPENPVDVTARVVEDGGRTLVAILDLLGKAPGFDIGLVLVSLVSPARLAGIEQELAAIHASRDRPLVFCSPGVVAPQALALIARVGGLCLDLSVFARTMRRLDDHRAFRERWRRRRVGDDATAVATAPVRPLPATPGVLDGPATRQLLETWGLPLPRETIVADADAAARAAQAIGAPVAVKIVSPDVPHKTEAGGVELGLDGPEQVRAAAMRILERVARHQPGARIDGLQVQAMVPTGREMVVGVTRDPDFGPLVMVGFGGIHVEVLRQTVFGLAPLQREDAHAMILALKGHELLSGVRGEAASDVDALAELLVTVSRLALAHADRIAEIDLNPVVVLGAGRGAVVVDALVVVDAQAPRERP